MWVMQKIRLFSQIRSGVETTELIHDYEAFVQNVSKAYVALQCLLKFWGNF